jgi:hypothetical protein
MVWVNIIVLLLIKDDFRGSTMRFTDEMSEADAIVLVERLTHQVIAGEINPDRYTSVLSSLPYHLRDNVLVACAAVTCFSPALLYFTPNIRGNEQVIAAALSTDPERIEAQMKLFELFETRPETIYMVSPIIMADDSIRNKTDFSNRLLDYILAFIGKALTIRDFDPKTVLTQEAPEVILTQQQFKAWVNQLVEAQSSLANPDFDERMEQEVSELVTMLRVIHFMRYSQLPIRGEEECILQVSQVISESLALACSTNDLFNEEHLRYRLGNNGANKYLAAQLFSVSGYHTRRNKIFLEKYINSQNVGFNHLIAYEDYTESDLLQLCLRNPRLLQNLPYPSSQKKEWLFSVMQNRANGLMNVTIPRDFYNFMRNTIGLIPSCFKGINNQLCDSAIFLCLAQQSAELSIFAYPRCDQLLLSSAHVACLFVKYQGHKAYELLDNRHQSSADVLDFLRNNAGQRIDAVNIPAQSRDKIKNITLFYENTFCRGLFDQILPLPPFIGMALLNEFLTFTDRLRLSMVKKIQNDSVSEGVEIPIESMEAPHFSIQ